MPVQKTFTIIPQYPTARDSPDRVWDGRPMTSKQVQKAYKASNRAPRMSRAEARKQERAEQERIRKEYEREQASARAKAAREKKKEKEAKIREEKKRKGLPLVNVRPSQDTISRFFRKNGNGNKRDSGGVGLKMVEEEAEPGAEMSPPRMPSPRPIESEDVNEIFEDEDTTICGHDEDAVASIEQAPKPVTELSLPPIPSPRPVASEDRNEILGGEDTSYTGVLDERGSAHVLAEMEQAPETAHEASHIQDCEIPTSPAAPRNWILDLEGFGESFEEDFNFEVAKEDEIPVHEANDMGIPEAEDEIPKQSQFKPKENFSDDLDEEFDEDIETEMLQGLEAILEQRAAGSPLPATPSLPKHTSQNPPPSSRPRTRYEEDLGLQIPTEDELCQRAPIRSSHPRLTPSPRHRVQDSPLSTQAILCNFDDFFPSPSQQARELEEERVSQPSPIPQLQSSVQPNSPPPPQRRFFTSSGSHELIALALQRSRRTAALEEFREKERMKLEVGMIATAEAAERKRRRRMMQDSAKTREKPPPTKPSTAVRDVSKQRAPGQPTPLKPMKNVPKPPPTTHTPNQPTAPKRPREQPQEPCKRQKTSYDTHKTSERQKMPETTLEYDKENHLPPAPSASQETEYGGGWVDEIDVELML